MICRLGKN